MSIRKSQGGQKNRLWKKVMNGLFVFSFYLLIGAELLCKLWEALERKCHTEADVCLLENFLVILVWQCIRVDKMVETLSNPRIDIAEVLIASTYETGNRILQAESKHSNFGSTRPEHMRVFSDMIILPTEFVGCSLHCFGIKFSFLRF